MSLRRFALTLARKETHTPDLPPAAPGPATSIPFVRAIWDRWLKGAMEMVQTILETGVLLIGARVGVPLDVQIAAGHEPPETVGMGHITTPERSSRDFA